jgi:DNA-binding MarR family transcriptional regulator
MAFTELHLALLRVGKLHRHLARQGFEEFGITQGQPRILDFLKEHDGCIQRDLAENCHIEPATVTSVLSNMERDDLIYRAPNPKDRRVLNVFLTEKGKKALREVERVFKELETISFKDFTIKEKEETLQFLNRMADNLKEESK